jgi:hypothetical protein
VSLAAAGSGFRIGNANESGTGAESRWHVAMAAYAQFATRMHWDVSHWVWYHVGIVASRGIHQRSN